MALVSILVLSGPFPGAGETEQDASGQVPAVVGASREPTAADREAPASSETGSLPEQGRSDQFAPLQIPFDARTTDLAALALPPCPYSISTGAYRELRDAETSLREQLSRSLPAYIVPVQIQGSLAQSLYGVTQDGLWYQVLVGHYASREQARETLRVLMDPMSPLQPEIVKFTYALECGRFLDAAEADRLVAALSGQGFFPYLETYPISDDRKLFRVLVGACFSRRGTIAQKGDLDLKGFPCTIAQR
ncbi:MAG: SPOR domain-containing protein [bacterium]